MKTNLKQLMKTDPNELKQLTRQMEQYFPELKGGTDRREAAAKKCAEQDAPILKKDVARLTALYEVLFLGIATEELFQECAALDAKSRWNLVEPFTW
jgi:uncharacterized phage protein gp47/JayE